MSAWHQVDRWICPYDSRYVGCIKVVYGPAFGWELVDEASGLVESVIEAGFAPTLAAAQAQCDLAFQRVLPGVRGTKESK